MDKAKCFYFPATPDGHCGQTQPWLTVVPAAVVHCMVPRKGRDFSAVLQLLPTTLHSTFHRGPLTYPEAPRVSARWSTLQASSECG